MPAQKRSHDSTSPPEGNGNDDDTKQPEVNETNDDDNNNGDEQVGDGEDNLDSDESPPPSPGENDEFVMVKLSEIRKEVQCPICLGIIRKTRTVMECLHRFCRECIDKAMRLGNNECPACRTHCASRRSLRDDPNYDALIATLYPDIEKYEEEELAFHEEEKARNQLIQASIEETFRRQTEALGKKRTSARATAAAFMRRSQRNYRTLRGRRNQRVNEQRESDEDQDGNNSNKDSSSSERSPEPKPKRYKRRNRSRSSEPSSPAAAAADVAFEDNNNNDVAVVVGVSAGLAGSSDIFSWGKGGMRSNNRHGSMSGANKLPRNSRLSKLIDSFRCSKEKHEKNEGLDMNVMLVSLHDEVPNLQRPYICCEPTLSVGHLCHYIATQTSMQEDKIEMLVVKDVPLPPIFSSSIFEPKPFTIDPSKNELHALEEHLVMAEIQSMWGINQHHLVLAYREKVETLVM